MSGKRTYSPEERQAALAALDVNLGNCKRTATQLGIPYATLVGFRDEARQANLSTNHSKNGTNQTPQDASKGGKPSRRAVKRLLADAFESVAWRLVRMAPRAARIARDKGNLGAIMMGAGIATDKMRLLREQATSLPGSALSPEDKVKRMKELEAAAAARKALAEQETAAPPAPAPIYTEKPADHTAVDALVDLAQPHPDRPTDARPGGGPTVGKG